LQVAVALAGNLVVAVALAVTDHLLLEKAQAVALALNRQ
jgi:hypothetical protein